MASKEKNRKIEQRRKRKQAKRLKAKKQKKRQTKQKAQESEELKEIPKESRPVRSSKAPSPNLSFNLTAFKGNEVPESVESEPPQSKPKQGFNKSAWGIE